MKVVVACDEVAGLDGLAASQVIAESFARKGATVAVAPLGISGKPLQQALGSVAASHAVACPQTIAEVLDHLAMKAASATVLDLTSGVFDLDEVLNTDLASLGLAEGGQQLVALASEAQASAVLTGLHGAAAQAGRAAGKPLAEVIASDTRAQEWLSRHGLIDQPGAGAASGLGALVQSAGGQVLAPLDFLSQEMGLAATMRQADVVVTGAASLDFHSVGGPIVKYVAGLAEAALVPCIAVVGHNYVSARELRLAGLEASYPLVEHHETAINESQLREVADRVAQTWSW